MSGRARSKTRAGRRAAKRKELYCESAGALIPPVPRYAAAAAAVATSGSFDSIPPRICERPSKRARPPAPRADPPEETGPVALSGEAAESEPTAFAVEHQAERIRATHPAVENRARVPAGGADRPEETGVVGLSGEAAAESEPTAFTVENQAERIRATLPDRPAVGKKLAAAIKAAETAVETTALAHRVALDALSLARRRQRETYAEIDEQEEVAEARIARLEATREQVAGWGVADVGAWVAALECPHGGGCMCMARVKWAFEARKIDGPKLLIGRASVRKALARAFRGEHQMPANLCPPHDLVVAAVKALQALPA
jgi:hypothetical protein